MGGDSSSSKRRAPNTEFPVSRTPGDACDISFTTRLAHVRTAHTANLRAGAILSVELEIAADRKAVVCRETRTREIIGYILTRGVVVLIDCIEKGNEYSAEVTTVDFGLVEVAVQRSL